VSTTVFPEHLAASVVPSAALGLVGEGMRRELESLRKELKEVESQLALVQTTIHGLSVVVDPKVLGPELLDLCRRPRRNVRGLTSACRAVLKNVLYPCSVGTVCTLVNALDPSLLSHHRNAMASVMSVLRMLARRGEITRGLENGRSVWQWAGE
jgi:hypothetical protein